MLKKDVIFLTSRFPYPLNKGDKLRAFHQIRTLSNHANVHLISLSENKPSLQDIEALEPYCKSIHNFVLSKEKRIYGVLRNVFSNQPFSVSYFYNTKIKKAIELKIRELNPDVIHCHLIRMTNYVNSSYHSKMTLDYMDCFSNGAVKELSSTKNYLRILFLKEEAKRLKAFEQNCFDKFHQHFVISINDNNALPVKDNSGVIVLPNGVDFTTYYPKVTNTIKEYDLLFSGHMGYVPNISAAKFAIKEIIPALSSKSKLLIAGIGVTSEISKLRSEQIIIQEHFSHIRDAFWNSKILLAPMNISIGLQNKILQAMAMKIPVVCTPQANLAINAPDGVAICIASTPKEFNEVIQHLLNEPEFYNEIANNAYDFVLNNFNWDIINNKFSEMLLEEF